MIPSYCTVPPGLKRGDKGDGVKRLQEWLCHHGHLVKVDSDFGPATERALLRFAGRRDVSPEVARALVAPMERALAAVGTLVDVARAYLDAGARELGGQNAGPWVRLFTGGLEGPAWAWCGVFVAWCAKQAGAPNQDLLSPNCDTIGARARIRGRLVSTPEVGGLFLVRGPSAADPWTHVGIVDEVLLDARGKPEAVGTIEGNSNDEGSREGHEVCERTRGLGRLDFVRMAA